jgi:hypothetical protein
MFLRLCGTDRCFQKVIGDGIILIGIDIKVLRFFLDIYGDSLTLKHNESKDHENFKRAA